MFSKPKVQKGIPRPKHLMSTTAGTRQPIIRDTAEELRRKRGNEEGEKREKRWGNSAYRIANPTAQCRRQEW
jgi:hypothetical protein